jgi:4'-phosphopantetheinyl transferase
MIHWLTQSQAELSGQTGFLNETETARLATLKTAKRQQDWLLGRWTAKRLLQTVLFEAEGTSIPLDMITIMNNQDGVPDYRLPITDHRLSISISHSHGRAFVAAIEKADALIGADMEKIESRPTGFGEAYFTMAEIVLGYGLAGQERAVWETAVWIAKEAVLKALHLGLSVDTRAISCLIEPVARPSSNWMPFAVRFDQKRLPKPAPALNGWWRV